MLRIPLALSAAAIAVTSLAGPAGAQTAAEQRRFDTAQRRYDSESSLYQRERRLYEDARARDSRRSGYNDPRYNDPRYNDPRYSDPRYTDPRYDPNYDSRYATDYDASRYYRDDPRYQERALSANDQVYRGSDGRYYCKRNDGTSGLIVGGAGGAVLGNVIDGGRNRVAGTLIGGALGAILGKSVDQNSGSNSNSYRCR